MKEIKVYKKETCPYCQAAMKLLKENQIDFESIEVNELPPEKWEGLKASSGMNTVPQIFVNGSLVGGYTELAAKVEAEGIGWLKE